MDNLKLTLEPRSVTGKKVKNLRKQGVLPASICGKGIPNGNFQLDLKEFSAVYRQAGRTALIELQLPDGKQSAFVRQLQIHPVSRVPIHVDFHVVDLLVAMTADVPVVTVGENSHVQRGEAVISLALQALHVRGLPADLPQSVELDISDLDVGTTLYVSDLSVGDNIEVLTPADQGVLSLTPSRMAAEAEEVAAEVAAEGEAPEDAAEAARAQAEPGASGEGTAASE